MHQPYRIELFGGLQVSIGDRIITQFGTQKNASLLAFLAFHLHQTHPREILAERFWPDVKSALGSLSAALASLRRQLEPPGIARGSVIQGKGNRQSVWLNPEAVTTDILDFENLLKAAPRAGSSSERAQRLSDAIALYRGEFLAGYYDDWVITEQQRLAAVYFQALDSVIAHLIQTGEYQKALEYAHRAVRMAPLRENAYMQMMCLYAALNQPTAALQQYVELERLLKERLETAPFAAIRKLARDVKDMPTMGVPLIPELELPQASHDANSQNGLATSTITLLAMDIDKSRALPERCSAVLRASFAEHGGELVRDASRKFLVAFATASQALACAVTCQRALVTRAVDKGFDVAVQMALHTGEVNREGGSYDGAILQEAWRLMVAAHGGQILCSQTTAELLRRVRPQDVSLVDLGLYRLRGGSGPERLFQVAYPSLVRDFPPLRLEAGYQSRLPLLLTRFFGREAEITQLQEALSAEDTRLVTLTGPGGAGKTRLSLEVAYRLQDSFSGALWFAPLADVSDAHLIAGAVADAMGLQRSPVLEPMQQVVEALGRQRSLLVLDNFEQIADEGGDTIRTLLNRVPTLTCFVTSRQTLALTGERVFDLAPLRTPEGADTPETLTFYDSVRLFVDRAQAKRPDFQVTSQNAPAVAELSRRLEGIPLAIELAAARAQTLSPGQMLAQMERRFDLLVTRQRDIEARHRTMRAVIDWSYQMLPPQMQRFFASLSVFWGGWTAEAAEAVCGAGESEGARPGTGKAWEYLLSMRECSLIIASESGAADDSPVWFRMLETFREYAREKLTPDELSTLERRHAEYFLQLLDKAAPGIRGPRQAYWLDRLEAEHDNLRAALQWTREHDPGLGLRLAATLPLFWDIRGHWREGYLWLIDMLERDQGGDPPLRAKALLAIGNLAKAQGNYPAARDAFLVSYDLLVAQDSEHDLAFVLNGLGVVAQEQGDYSEAHGYLEASLAIKQKLGDHFGEATARGNLGYLAYLQHDVISARGYLEAAVAILRDTGKTHVLANVLNNLGGVTRREGIDYIGARVLLEESLNLRLKIGDQKNLAYSFDEFAQLAAAQKEPALAVQLLSAAEALRARLGCFVSPSEQQYRNGLVALLHKDLGEDGFLAEWQRGQSLSVQEAIAVARIGQSQ